LGHIHCGIRLTLQPDGSPGIGGDKPGKIAVIFLPVQFFLEIDLAANNQDISGKNQPF
jgi:hypothetical protein